MSSLAVEQPGPGRSIIGIPVLKERESKGRPTALHQGEIRRAWNEIYDRSDAEVVARGLKEGTPVWRDFVRDELNAGRDYLDKRLGAFWGESKSSAGLRPPVAPEIADQRGHRDQTGKARS